MEEKNPIKTSFVSRLPKYGTKPVGSILQTVPNGTVLNLSGNSQSIDKNLSKHNGTLRMSSFSFNWRKSNKYHLGNQTNRESISSHNSNEKLNDSEKHPQSQSTVGQEVVRIGLNSTSSQIGKQSNMFVSSTEELSQNSLPGLPRSAKFSKSSLLGRTSYSGLNAPKSYFNGICGTQSTVGFQKNRSNSTIMRSNSGDSLSESTENVKSFCEKMVRSQSFSHSVQNTLLPPTILTRSHSFNRAVDLTRPYQKQHLAIRTSQRSNLLLNAQQLEIPSSNEPLMYGLPRSYTTLASSGLKKLPLSNGSGDAPSLRFRTGHPSLLKPSSQRMGRKIPMDGSTNNDNEKSLLEDSLISINVCRGTDEKDTHNSERPEVTEVYNLVEDDGKLIFRDGDVDEISISSLSSSEKNDLSEDFSDDFVDLEYQNRTIRIQEEKISVQELQCGNEIPLNQLLSLKENERSSCNSDEWLDIRVSAVHDKSKSANHPSGNNVISSDQDVKAGSSFELSPSDSSDGTYMWDEEGLEPIGSVHPCGSFDSSEMNSIDILNNLDSCDLEDDDLMLDVDLPEDVPSDNGDYEKMNIYERPDRNIRQQKEGPWKRTPQCWNTQDRYRLGHIDHRHHIRNDLNRTSNYLDSPVGHLEGYGAPCLYPPFVSLPPNTVMLDEMTLRHMVQDCTTVKTQLLKMKRILNQNDENVSLHNITLSLPASPDLQDPEPIHKSDDLLSEITQLKEDLKKKDETIRQLEYRLSIRCNCSRGGQKSEVSGRMYADKYTQTSSRKSAPQALQPSSRLPCFTDITQGKLIKTSHIVAHSEHPNQDLQRKNCHEYQNAVSGSFTRSLNEPSTLNMQLKKPEENAHSIKNIKTRDEIGELTGRKVIMPQSHPSLQSPTQVSTQEVQTKSVPKKHYLRTNQVSSPKTSKLTKPPYENDLVPPSATVAEESQEDCSAPKEPELLPPSSPTQLQLASSQSNLNRKSQRISKLRPPIVSFRPKQTTNPKLSIPSEPQNIWSKTTRLKQPTQTKDMQNQSSSIHSGDSVTSDQHSRLPKPKT